jgi:hypothetical protein
MWFGGVVREPGGLEYILAGGNVAIHHPNTLDYVNTEFRMVLMKVE